MINLISNFSYKYYSKFNIYPIVVTRTVVDSNDIIVVITSNRMQLQQAYALNQPLKGF